MKREWKHVLTAKTWVPQGSVVDRYPSIPFEIKLTSGWRRLALNQIGCAYHNLHYPTITSPLDGWYSLCVGVYTGSSSFKLPCSTVVFNIYHTTAPIGINGKVMWDLKENVVICCEYDVGINRLGPYLSWGQPDPRIWTHIMLYVGNRLALVKKEFDQWEQQNAGITTIKTSIVVSEDFGGDKFIRPYHERRTRKPVKAD